MLKILTEDVASTYAETSMPAPHSIVHLLEITDDVRRRSIQRKECTHQRHLGRVESYES